MTETTTSHSGDVRIIAPVIIREVIDSRVCRAALPNGKLIHGFADRPGVVLQEGAAARALLSLCDFSKGEII